jgi:hypothetical protein
MADRLGVSSSRANLEDYRLRHGQCLDGHAEASLDSCCVANANKRLHWESAPALPARTGSLDVNLGAGDSTSQVLRG